MIELYKNIKKKRLEKGMSQDALASLTGYTDRSSITKIEKGEVDLPESKISIFAKALSTTAPKLMGWVEDDDFISVDNIFPIETRKIPLLGEIACGVPQLVEEYFESYVEVGTNIQADFCLKAKGDSMINARIFEGDIVFVKRQSDVNNGDIAVVYMDGDATLKRVYKYAEMILLRAENSAYKEIEIHKDDFDTVQILGKAIAFQSNVK